MRAVEGHKKTVNFRCLKKKMVARCREIIEDHGRTMVKTLRFSEDGYCSCLPTDSTVKNELRSSEE